MKEPSPFRPRLADIPTSNGDRVVGRAVIEKSTAAPRPAELPPAHSNPSTVSPKPHRRLARQSPRLDPIGQAAIMANPKGMELASPAHFLPHPEDVDEEPDVPPPPPRVAIPRPPHREPSVSDDVLPGPSQQPALGAPQVAPPQGAGVSPDGLSWAQQDLYQYLKSTSWHSSAVVAAIRASGGKGDNGSRTVDVIRQWSHIVGTLTDMPTPYADPKRVRVTSGVLGLFLQHSDDWCQNAYQVYRYLQQEPTNEAMRNALANLGTRPMGMATMAKFLKHYAV